MNAAMLPRVLSPNLGCPVIVSLKETACRKDCSFTVIVAAGPSGEGVTGAKPPKFRLAPIGTLRENSVKLEICRPIRRIDDWSTLSPLPNIDGTRLLFNKILHYEVLGPETTYFEVQVRLGRKESEKLQQERLKNTYKSPILCDLIAQFPSDSHLSSELVNRHALQLVDTFDREFNFIHLTDLHLARRNDELLDEILHLPKKRRPKITPERPKRTSEEIGDSFVNFNDRFREFIQAANRLADDGKLDFVVISGDLVDFAYHGWEFETNYAENNWRTFINILTGSGNEALRKIKGKEEDCVGNPGLKVAVFTSTGNHDWRLLPYNPFSYGQSKRFGLKADEMTHFAFKSYDELRHEKRREALAPEIAERHLDNWNLGALKGEYGLKLAKWVATETSQNGFAAVSGLLGFVGADSVMSKRTVGLLMRWGVPVLVGGALGLVAKSAFNDFMKRKIEFLMDCPLRAESMALHHYLLHINPYLDYGFRFGKHHFILMDTGRDVVTGKLLDGKSLSDLKRLSMDDNVLGGSPDSRSFDSERLYYNWSQVVWLEKVLEMVESTNKQSQNKHKDGNGAQSGGPGRTFVFLHAPPLNTEMFDADVAKKLWEQGEQPLPISKDSYKLTFGTINHYVSEFLYLCLGYLEREVLQNESQPEPERNPKLSGVDIVFSGHAHRALEFRLKFDADTEDKILIYSSNYSETQDDLSNDWWLQYRPVLVQTPACGVTGKCNINPPYFRRVKVSSDGSITQFRVENLMGEAPVDRTCSRDMRVNEP